MRIYVFFACSDMPEGENIATRTAVTAIASTVAGINNTLRLLLDRLDALNASLNSLAARIETLRRGMTLEIYTAPGTIVERRVVESITAKRSGIEITTLQRSVEVRPA
jgi:hypothetical protein